MASLVPWGGVRGWEYDPFAMDVWDPLDLRRGGGGWPSWDVGAFLGRTGDDDTLAIARTFVDWQETPAAHIFHADLPGVKREELNVHVEDGNILQISGERTKEEEESTDTWHRAERRRGSFLRRFRLPQDADMDAVRCELAHGVLTVTVPKREAGGPVRSIRAVDIAAAGD
ncbi:16.9 kDa class I heat shock protein 1-like [Wolffia australiana]